MMPDVDVWALDDTALWERIARCARSQDMWARQMAAASNGERGPAYRQALAQWKEAREAYLEAMDEYDCRTLMRRYGAPVPQRTGCATGGLGPAGRPVGRTHAHHGDGRAGMAACAHAMAVGVLAW